MSGVENQLLHLELPQELAHVWDWFLPISNRRTFRADGFPNRVPFSEVQAWTYLTGNVPSAREAALLFDLDDAFIEIAAEKDDVVMVPATADSIAKILDDKIERDKKGGLK